LVDLFLSLLLILVDNHGFKPSNLLLNVLEDPDYQIRRFIVSIHRSTDGRRWRGKKEDLVDLSLSLCYFFLLIYHRFKPASLLLNDLEDPDEKIRSLLFESTARQIGEYDRGKSKSWLICLSLSLSLSLLFFLVDKPQIQINKLVTA
jgi:hypothetical protein